MVVLPDPLGALKTKSFPSNMAQSLRHLYHFTAYPFEQALGEFFLLGAGLNGHLDGILHVELLVTGSAMRNVGPEERLTLWGDATIYDT